MEWNDWVTSSVAFSRSQSRVTPSSRRTSTRRRNVRTRCVNCSYTLRIWGPRIRIAVYCRVFWYTFTVVLLRSPLLWYELKHRSDIGALGFETAQWARLQMKCWKQDADKKFRALISPRGGDTSQKNGEVFGMLAMKTEQLVTDVSITLRFFHVAVTIYQFTWCTIP
jgi:hypothetical protein